MNLAEDPDTVQRFVKKHALPFLILLDERGDSPRMFGLWAHPNTALIDREGKVVALVRGERDWRSAAARGLVRYLLQPGRSPAKEG